MTSVMAQNEAKILAPYAVRSSETLGRKFKEAADKKRLCFQKDRDRIIHCKAFRRLDQKTQVFIAGSGDHYRTRLTHTLEVAQISRGIARRLRLNEDLAEAIALAHDLGHPPFGHAGESTLNELMQRFGLHFEHNEQSKKVVELLEKNYPRFDGLNLSLEVLDGLIKHQTAYDQEGKAFEISAHLEAQVVNIADEIAYINHDIDDGLRSGILDLKMMNKLVLWKVARVAVEKKYGKIRDSQVMILRTVSALMSQMIDDVCVETEKNIKKFKINSVAEVRSFQGVLAKFSPKMKVMVTEMREFLFNTFYMSKEVVSTIDKGQKMVKALFNYYYENPQMFPKKGKTNKIERVMEIKDYIAGMTDRFLVSEYNTAIVTKK